jgi:hypothetical protein
MGGLWIGAGMWLGGIVNGFVGGALGGLTGSLPFGNVLSGLASAYIVGWIGDRFGNGTLMGAGAFAGVAMSALTGVIGGAGSLVSSLTTGMSTGGGATTPQPAQAPSAPTASQTQLRAVA